MLWLVRLIKSTENHSARKTCGIKTMENTDYVNPVQTDYMEDAQRATNKFAADFECRKCNLCHRNVEDYK